VRPKGQAETSLVHGVTTVARPGDAELMRMPRHRLGEAELTLPPWHRPGEVEQVLPPWHRPGEVEQVLPPWHRPGEDEQVLPAWHRHQPTRLGRGYRRGIDQARLNRCYLRAMGIGRASSSRSYHRGRCPVLLKLDIRVMVQLDRWF
jgi:hypothetical protein